MAGPGRHEAVEEPTPVRGFRAEVRDAVTGRAAVLVLAVLLIQLAFILSYLGAFHAPAPRKIPIGVVAPAGAPAGAADETARTLNGLDGTPLSARAVADAGVARGLIDDRTLYGALLLGPQTTDELLVTSAAGGAVSQALTTIAGQVEAAQQRTVTVTDAVPAGSGDARGLSAFYVVVGWVVGGYLVSAILGIAGGARPANRRRAIIRLGALAVYAVASGLGGTLIAETVLSALSGHFLALWAFGALVVFAVGTFTMGLQVLLDIIGIGVAIVLFVVLGNPSAGGAYPSPLLPPFWAAIGPWLPPGAGTGAVRGIVYFGGAGTGQSVAVLAGYAVVGLVLILALSGRRR